MVVATLLWWWGTADTEGGDVKTMVGCTGVCACCCRAPLLYGPAVLNALCATACWSKGKMAGAELCLAIRTGCPVAVHTTAGDIVK